MGNAAGLPVVQQDAASTGQGNRVTSAHVGEGGVVVEVAAAESLGQRRSHRCRMARLSRVSVHDFDWPAGANAMADSRPEPISAPFF